MSKVVVSTYICESTFKIPKGLDLEDNTKVRDWHVKWNKLFITLVDETEIEVECEWDATESDFKYPDDNRIHDASEYNMESDDDECDCETLVSNIVCKECKNVLPTHTIAEHLDTTNKIHECPHVACCEADRLQVIADDERGLQAD